MMFTMQNDVPIAFTHAVQKATGHLRQAAYEPLRVAVRFGEGAMEEIPVELLRRLFAIERLWDVPLEFPEEPGSAAGLIEITAEAREASSTWRLSPEMVTRSA